MAAPNRKEYYSEEYSEEKSTSSKTQVRRAERVPRTRINNDWEYLNKKKLSSNASTDQIFNSSYQNQGLQPQQLADGKVNRGNQAANQDNLEPVPSNRERQGYRSRRVGSTNKKSVSPLASKIAYAKKMAARARATAINASIFAWGGSLWISVQLPFAILSLATIGIASVFSAALSSSGFIGSSVAWVASKVAAGINYISGINIDLAAMSESLFVITYLIVFVIGALTLLGAYLQYTSSLLRPLSGEKSSLKMGMLLIAVVGYAVPIANILPWAVLWMFAVWKYPK